MTCTWDLDPTLLNDKWREMSEDQRERAALLATSTLQSLTLYRVGTCPITIRPCPDRPVCGCTADLYRGSFHPHVSAQGRWYNNCHHRPLCKPLSEVDIPGPVGYIDSLRIDGEEVDLYDGSWRLDDGHLLVWQGDGPSPIPSYQDLNKGDDQPGTWSITYSQSYPVLADARMAVTLLALEYAAAMRPKGKCSLPRGVTNVVRNGVTFTVDAGLFLNGLTGIEVVDAFVSKWVPVGSPGASAIVMDPRRRRARIVSAVPQRRQPPLGGSS